MYKERIAVNPRYAGHALVKCLTKIGSFTFFDIYIDVVYYISNQH